MPGSGREKVNGQQRVFALPVGDSFFEWECSLAWHHIVSLHKHDFPLGKKQSGNSSC
jgi:hypothetical protein